jgi:hypothetical protein
MYIYSVTVNIDEQVHQEWLTWMKNTHIPAVLATGKFTKAKMCLVMINEDMGGITYSVQYTTVSLENLHAYYKDHAEKLRADGKKRFSDKFVVFRTELKVISEQFSKTITN